MEESRHSDRRGARGAQAGKKRRPKKKTAFRKKRPPLTLEFNYKELNKMVPFLTDDGKILGARVSGLRAFQQRQLTTAVKRARHLGFLSTVAREFIH